MIRTLTAAVRSILDRVSPLADDGPGGRQDPTDGDAGTDQHPTDEDVGSRFVPSPLDRSVRSAHGGPGDGIDRELAEIDERARELEEERRG